jgi:hypothetical protein
MTALLVGQDFAVPGASRSVLNAERKHQGYWL